MAGAATGQVRPAEVLYLQQDGFPTPAFRVGDECFVPVDQTATWGWKVSVQAGQAVLNIDGRTLNVPTRHLSGRVVVPLRRIVTELGASSEWQGSADALSVFVVPKSVQVDANQVNLRFVLPVRPSATRLMGPNRFVLDLPGVRVPEDAKFDLPPNARLFQYRQNAARLVVETPFVPEVTTLGASAEVTAKLLVDERVTDVTNITPIEVLPPPPTPAVVADTKVLVQPEIRSAGPGRSVLSLKVQPGLPKKATFNKPDPSTIEITLPGVQASLPPSFVLGHEAISAVEARQEPLQSVILVRLNQPMGAELSSRGGTVSLVLSRPTNLSGNLAGKTVVVDPGHGGEDSGAIGGGFREKDLSLAVSKALSRKLAEAGATVVLTRTQDVFVPLLERNRIAERNRADLFISVHINSSPTATPSGGITFFHQQDWVSKLMAECVQHEIAKVSGIPNLGVWSDRRIHKSGFSVLRNSSIPSVLLELGFIKNPRDRGRLTQSSFQQSVAAAIVKGVRVFLGDDPVSPMPKPAPVPAKIPVGDPASIGAGG